MNEAGNTERKITVLCNKTEFAFPLNREDDAWYCLDGRESRNGGETLVLNADRDVYAVYTAGDGSRHYGTVGDDDNRVLADNEGICPGDRYVFYEDPRTEKYYV